MVNFVLFIFVYIHFNLYQIVIFKISRLARIYRLYYYYDDMFIMILLSYTDYIIIIALYNGYNISDL